MFKKWNYPTHQMLQNAEVDGVDYIIMVESGKDQRQIINQWGRNEDTRGNRFCLKESGFVGRNQVLLVVL